MQGRNSSLPPKVVAIAGVTAWAMFALPVWLPPPAEPHSPATAATSLIGRLFPDVPAAWILIRLGALIGGAILLSAAAKSTVPFRSDPSTAAPPTRTAVALALVTAALHALTVPIAGMLGPAGQTLFMAGLILPAAILLYGQQTAPGAPRKERNRCFFPTLLLVTVAWSTGRMLLSRHSPRAADPVDMWFTFAGLEQLYRAGGNVLVDPLEPEALPGIPATPLFFQGATLLQLAGVEPSLAWLQFANSLGLAIAAAILAIVVRSRIGSLAGIAAATVFLCSPYALLHQIVPDVGFIGSLFTATIALLVVRYTAHHSLPALALLGGVLGVGSRYPALAALVVGAVLATGITVWRRRSSDLPVASAALLSFAAGFLPGLPSPSMLWTMARTYVTPEIQSSVLQEAVLSQRTLEEVITGWSGSVAAVIDVPIAAILAPFAIPRTNLRLWGDALFDPTGAFLAAVGVALCIRLSRRNDTARSVLIALALAIAPAFLSNTDRPSIGRMFGMPIIIAFLAGLGFRAILGLLPRTARPRLATAGLALVAAGGIVLFDVVTPGLVRNSSLGLVLRALDPTGDERASYVVDTRIDQPWLFIAERAFQVPARPLAVQSVDDWQQKATRSSSRDAGQEIIFWSPATETSAGVRARFCRQHPDGVVYELRDQSRLSRAYAAHTEARPWRPSLDDAQWARRPCR